MEIFAFCKLGISVSRRSFGDLSNYKIEGEKGKNVGPTNLSYPKVYIPSATKTQMNLVFFCFLVVRAVLGIPENSTIDPIMKSRYLRG